MVRPVSLKTRILFSFLLVILVLSVPTAVLGYRVIQKNIIRRADLQVRDSINAAQIVYTGDQPYYVKRHVGQIGMASGEGRALVVHGIGKKVPAVYREGKTKRSKVLVSPERTDRIWVLPSGAVCGGEDVEAIALAALSMMEWQPG